MNTKEPRYEPSAWISAIPLLTLIVLLALTVSIFGSDSLSGPSQISLIVATAVAASLAMGCCGVKWKDIEAEIENKIRSTTVSIYILLIIGMLSASWMVSGIVPTLICYGIHVISPQVFLASACVISAVISLMTGSSWTTIATIGIALLGIGRALGIEDGWTAGAIISGAYFGDKMSPLSDTTVLASSVSGTPLFRHISYMMFTTTPTIMITLVIFILAGLFMDVSDASDAPMFVDALEKSFIISPWLLIVPVLTAFMIYKKVPSLVVLFASSMAAVIMAIIFQPHILMQIAGHTITPAVAHGEVVCMPQTVVALFEGVVRTLSTSTAVETGVPLLNDLVSTSGMAGMLDTIWLILCAMIFGGTMHASGMLSSFFKAVFRRMVRTRVGLVFATVFSGVAVNVMTGDQYISIILTANMFKEEYTKRGYETRLLSRSTEDSATVVSVLIPWNTCGMTQSTVLGVATMTYLPYCFFCLLSPVMSVVQAALGWKIKKLK